MNNQKKNYRDNKKDQKDLTDHGVQDIIPKDEEYYTLDLRRGNDTDINDISKIDIAGNNPLDVNEVDDIILHEDKSTSSNAGGAVRQKDIVNQNSTAVVGEPGHWGVDEDAG